MTETGTYGTMKNTGRNSIDLRSDTVTRPGPEMRDAMANADVGDDVYGEDPSIIALEEKAANLLGKEAGLYLSSGTQSNLTAVLTHCGRGEEYIVGNSYHIFSHEAGGAAVLGGISPFPLQVSDRGGITADQVAAAIKPDDSHYPVTRLVCVENTVSGRVQDPDELKAISGLAHGRGLSVHLDGARLMNAAVALGKAPSELAEPMDSISLCLSKGLGAPVGSVLSGSADFIKRARRNRKILGGAMRQAGVLAACGIYALDHNIERLSEDHDNARALADGLSSIDALKVESETNMVFVEPKPEDHAAFCAHLAGDGIVTGGQSPKLRLVTHLDLSRDDIAEVVQSAKSFYG